MNVSIVELHWPRFLQPSGPKEDPSVLLAGISTLADARHLVYAMRINLDTLGADLRDDLDESVYADYRLDVMLDELLLFATFDRTSAVPLGNSYYIFWMVPFSERIMPIPGI
jgi:hypothetical protein